MYTYSVMGIMLLGNLAAASNPLPKFNNLEGEVNNITSIGFMGYTLHDGIEFVEGTFSGLLGEDVRETWEKCLVDTSELALEGYNDAADVDIDNISDPSTDMTLVTNIIQFIMSIIGKVPADIGACTGIFTDIMKIVNFVLHHLSPSQILLNLGSNLLTNSVALIAKAIDIMGKFFSHDFYSVGKDIGESVMLLVQ